MSGLLEKLCNYSKIGRIAFHMPGHKRNISRFPYLKNLGGNIDITEINGFDDLHNARGILKNTEIKLQKIYGGKRAFMLVNGSTCGIMAGIKSVVSVGDKIIIARNCHKSVYNAVSLLNLKPVYIMPEYNSNYGIYGCIKSENVQKVVTDNPDAKMIVITSPTYEGIISDVDSICKIAHSKNIPVLVDCAHGAHLNMLDKSIKSPVECGADITVMGLHKTLPSLTQTAAAILSGSLVDSGNFAYQLSFFETSSPSYVLMASVDSCSDAVLKGDLFKKWSQMLINFNKNCKLEKLRLLKNDGSFFSLDKSKITVFCSNTDIAGNQLADILRKRYNIECEMSYADYIIIMTGAGTTDEELELLCNALIEIDKSVRLAVKSNNSFILKSLPVCLIEPMKVDKMNKSVTDINNCIGKISADYIFAYPPGIPLIVPGEIIDENMVNTVNNINKAGTVLIIPNRHCSFDGNLTTVS